MAQGKSQVTPASVRKVEEDLAALWQQAGQGPEGLGAPSRSVLLTLVAVCCSPDAAERAAGMITAVTGDHPCRAIVVSAEEQQEGVSARVSVACQLVQRGDRHVCGEQIRLMAPAGQMRSVVASVLPLVLPDVPLVLWLAEGECPGTMQQRLRADFSRLLNAADRLLVDSSAAADVSALLGWLAEMDGSGGVLLVDLAWERAHRRRLAVAELFDPPERLPLLARVDGLDMLCGAGDSPRPGGDALLFAGWLTDRLRWQPPAPVPGETEQYTFPGEKRMCFRHEGSGGFGALGGVEFSEAGQPLLRVAFSEDTEKASWIFRSPDGAAQKGASRLLGWTPEQVLCGALEVSRRDSVYSGALQAAARMTCAV